MTYRTWRRILSPVLVPLTRVCHQVDPNLITFVALGLAIGAGLSFACSTVSVGLVLLALHVVADYLDGAVARASGRMSKLGDFLDHAADRLADVACLGGLAASGWVRPVVALSALICLAASIALGSLSGLLPAWRAARLSPVEAIRAGGDGQ